MTAAPTADWTDRAQCQGADPEVFYPRHGTSGRFHEEVIETWCRPCPVREECLADAAGQPAGERYGIWGGVIWQARRAPLDPFGFLDGEGLPVPGGAS